MGDRNDEAGHMAERERQEVDVPGLRLGLDHRTHYRDHQVAVGDHGAFGETRGAARVEEPCGRVLVHVAVDPFRTCGSDHVLVGRVLLVAASDHDDVLQRGDVRQVRLDGLEELFLDHEDVRLGVVEDPGPFLGVEAVVEEVERHAGVGNPVVALDVLGEVLGEDADTISDLADPRHGIGHPVDPLEQLAERHRLVCPPDGFLGRSLVAVPAHDVSDQHDGSSRVQQAQSPRLPVKSMATSMGDVNAAAGLPGARSARGIP